MNRKERVYDILSKVQFDKDNFNDIKDIAMDATQISNILNADRSNTSRYLNDLVKEGKIIKINGRPVKFIDKNIYNEINNINHSKLSNNENQNNNKDNDTDPFQELIGANASLKTHIEQAKSAVLYPPRGLHTLLTGPTGTGKSTFAEKFYEYAIQMKTIDEKAKFVVFNCAEYAENPQLVMSQLFGHIKGSFTGANTDKKGLIDEAEGGIILLDEIHRLSPDCQELLFMLMDKNVFRRLGETDTTRKANVLIIGATTEDINEALLKTFIRRMPVTINLPPLKDRHLSERLELIEKLFMAEQNNMDVPIRLHKDALIALLLYDCVGNVGQLKADVQIICARGFLKYKINKSQYVDISVSILPEHIQNGLLLANNKNDLIEFIKNSEEYHYFDSSKVKINDNNESKLVTQINERYNNFVKMGRSNSEINSIIDSELEVYLKDILDKYQMNEKDIQKENLLKIVDAKILDTCDDAINFAEMKLHRKLSGRIKIGMIMHINSLVTRISNGDIIENKKINEIVLNNPKEFKIAKFIFTLLEENLNIKIPKHEIGFLTMFLCVPEETESIDTIGVIVIAHGKSTASSMAEFVNNLLNTNHCKAIDMPIDMSVNSVFNNACQMVKEVDEGKGVLLLVDMGSLSMMGEMLKERTGSKICTVEMVSTLVVIEAVRKSILKDTELYSLKEDLSNIYINFTNKNNNQLYSKEEKTIITSCISGEGVAVKVENIIRESIDLKKYNISIENLDILSANNAKQILEEKGIKNVIAVVGTVNLNINDIPYIPIDELIVGNGIKKLEKIINKEFYHQNNEEDEIINKSVVKETLKNILTFLDANKANELLINAFEFIFSELSLIKTKDIFLRFIMHTGCMIERVLKDETVPYSNADKFIDENKNKYEIIKKGFEKCENTFNIIIPNDEIAYIIEILDQ